MKKTLLLAYLLLLYIGIVSAQEYLITIKGRVEFPDNNYPVSIFYNSGFEKITIDSIKLNEDNTFEKKVALPHPGLYGIDAQKWEILSFWGEDEDIEVDFRGQDTAKVKIKNPPYHYIKNPGPNNDLMNLINYFEYKEYQGMIKAGQEFAKASGSNCDNWKEYAKEGYNRNWDAALEDYKFLAKHYSDRNSAIVLINKLRNDKNARQKLIDKLEETKKDYYPFVQFKAAEKEKIEKLSKLDTGMSAPAFSFATLSGDVNLGTEDFKGKYLLIDFWASWCGPCIKAIPHLKEVYSKYNSQGLEILSVSIDGKKEDWEKALDTHKMPWKHVLAPNSGKDIMTEYQFNGIPHLVLVDKEGKIIQRNVSTQNLDALLEKVFVN